MSYTLECILILHFLSADRLNLEMHLQVHDRSTGIVLLHSQSVYFAWELFIYSGYKCEKDGKKLKYKKSLISQLKLLKKKEQEILRILSLLIFFSHVFGAAWPYVVQVLLGRNKIQTLSFLEGISYYSLEKKYLKSFI